MQVRTEVWGWRGVRPPRQPGWFADPFGRQALRYWDGATWTALAAGQTSLEGVVHDPVSLESPEGNDRRGVIGLSIAGLFCAFGLSGLVIVPLLLVGLPGGRTALLLVSEAGLWIGLLATCVLVSRRFGTGMLRVDFQLRVRWRDLGIGLVGGVVSWLIAGLISAPLTAPHSVTNPGRVLGLPASDAVDWTLIVLLTCVGAPLVEELFFRGLLQGELMRRYGNGVALPLTAVIFGACHVFNAPGVAGLIYAACIVGAGLILCVVFAITKRLGSSIATHAIFNGLTLAAVAFSLPR